MTQIPVVTVIYAQAAQQLLLDPAFIGSKIPSVSKADAVAQLSRLNDDQEENEDDDDVDVDTFSIISFKDAIDQAMMYPSTCGEGLVKLRLAGQQLANVIPAVLGADWLPALKAILVTDEHAQADLQVHQGGVVKNKQKGPVPGKGMKKSSDGPGMLKNIKKHLNVLTDLRANTLYTKAHELAVFNTKRSIEADQKYIENKTVEWRVTLTPDETKEALRQPRARARIRASSSGGGGGSGGSSSSNDNNNSSSSSSSSNSSSSSRSSSSSSSSSAVRGTDDLSSVRECEAEVKTLQQEMVRVLERRTALLRTTQSLQSVKPAEVLVAMTQALRNKPDRAYGTGPDSEFLAPLVLELLQAISHDPKKSTAKLPRMRSVVGSKDNMPVNRKRRRDHGEE